LADLSNHPTTSAPSPGIAQRIIHETFADADHLVIICVPASLSAVYNVLRLGAADLPQDRITQIDCGTTTMSMGFQVLAGAETAAQTGDLSQVLAAIERARRYIRFYAVPLSVEYLRRSGRVGWATASAANLLQIKPVITIADSVVSSLARVRTFSRAVDKIIELVEQQAPLDSLALLHANNPDGALEMKSRLGSIVPANTYIINVTPALGTHVGPTALGAVTLSKAWRQ
jgi:DegV family protein with EDD domain